MSLPSGLGTWRRGEGVGVPEKPMGRQCKLPPGAAWALPSLCATRGGYKAYPACLWGHAKGPCMGALPWALALTLAQGVRRPQTSLWDKEELPGSPWSFWGHSRSTGGDLAWHPLPDFWAQRPAPT